MGSHAVHRLQIRRVLRFTYCLPPSLILMQHSYSYHFEVIIFFASFYCFPVGDLENLIICHLYFAHLCCCKDWAGVVCFFSSCSMVHGLAWTWGSALHAADAIECILALVFIFFFFWISVLKLVVSKKCPSRSMPIMNGSGLFKHSRIQQQEVHKKHLGKVRKIFPDSDYGAQKVF